MKVVRLCPICFSILLCLNVTLCKKLKQLSSTTPPLFGTDSAATDTSITITSLGPSPLPLETSASPGFTVLSSGTSPSGTGTLGTSPGASGALGTTSGLLGTIETSSAFPSSQVGTSGASQLIPETTQGLIPLTTAPTGPLTLGPVITEGTGGGFTPAGAGGGSLGGGGTSPPSQGTGPNYFGKCKDRADCPEPCICISTRRGMKCKRWRNTAVSCPSNADYENVGGAQ